MIAIYGTCTVELAFLPPSHHHQKPRKYVYVLQYYTYFTDCNSWFTTILKYNNFKQYHLHCIDLYLIVTLTFHEQFNV